MMNLSVMNNRSARPNPGPGSFSLSLALLLGVAVGLSACEEKGSHALSGKGVLPQQVQLEVKTVGNIDRLGTQGAESDVLTKLYDRKDGLDLDVLSIRNEGDATVGIYPNISTRSVGAAVELHARLFTLGPRSRPPLCLVGGAYTPEESAVDYRSEFDIVSAHLVFSSGAVIGVPLDPEMGRIPGSDYISLRAGESAVLRWHVKLRTGFSRVSGMASIPGTGTAKVPMFYPAEFEYSDASCREEDFDGWYVRLLNYPEVSVFAEEEIHPLSLKELMGTAREQNLLPSESIRVFDSPRIPYDRVGQKFEGFPEFIF